MLSKPFHAVELTPPAPFRLLAESILTPIYAVIEPAKERVCVPYSKPRSLRLRVGKNHLTPMGWK